MSNSFNEQTSLASDEPQDKTRSRFRSRYQSKNLLRWTTAFHRLWIRLVASLHQSASYARSIMMTFAIIEIVGQPLYYYIWHDVYPQSYENIWLRAICVVVSLPMLFERQIQRVPEVERWLLLYWLFILLLQMPFFFVFMTLMNHLSAVWAMSSLAALMLLVILVFDWLLTLILSVLGAVLAWLLFIALGGHFQAANEIPGPVLIFIYAFGLLVGSAINYKSELIAREKLAAITDAVGTMAHELRTPLLGIRSGARGLNTYLPAVIEGYEMARDHKLPVSPIRHAHFHQMQSVLDRIDTESEYASVVLDMLLVNSNRASIDRTVFEPVYIQDCIDATLLRYPFHNAREREWIECDCGRNFRFLGSQLLMIHVLFNLLKNSIYHLDKAESGGRIEIWTTRDVSDFNQLHFRDNGPGISPGNLPRIFERFYSGMPRGQGTGIGLAFVRLVIDSFGGHIRCESVFGEYTEFIMTFPEMDDNGPY